MQKNEDHLAFKVSDVVFIMLINVKIPTIIGILTFNQHDKIHAQLSWAWKQFFYNLRVCSI